MALEEPRPVTNRDIFDNYVRHVIGTAYMDETPERILQRLEDGDTSVRTATNAVAIAQAAFLMTVVYSPNEEPAWLKGLWRLRHRFAELSSVISTNLHQFLNDSYAQIQAVDSKSADLETAKLMQDVGTALGHWGLLAKSSTWLWESSGIRHLPTDDPAFSLNKSSLLAQDVNFALLRAEFLQGEYSTEHSEDSLPDSFRFFGSEYAHYEPTFVGVYASDNPDHNWHFATKWHRRYLASMIDALVAAPKERTLLIWHWGALLELFLPLIRDLPSALSDIGPLSDSDMLGDLKDILNLSPDFSEYWAWQFGRLTTMWHGRVHGEGIPDDDMEYFYSEYESYLTAFSILDGDENGPDDPALIGALVTWANAHLGTDTYFRAGDFAPGIVNHSAYWIAKLGYRHERNSMNLRPAVPPAPPTVISPPDLIQDDRNQDTGASDVLMLGNIEGLAREMHRIQRESQLESEAEIADRLLRQLTEPVWSRLPDDSKYYLIEAESSLNAHPTGIQPGGATINYQRAVECALEDWLTAPHGRKDWPGARIGEWFDVLRKMRETDKPKRHRFDEIVRRQFDAEYASVLAAALDIVRDRRNREAHRDSRPPRPREVRDSILGKDNSPSIFELILRFAKNWPTK